MLAFHKVLAEMKFKEINGAAYLLLPEYRGPKSIGQIFGISYIFSMFLEFGLIRTNEKDKIEKAKAEKGQMTSSAQNLCLTFTFFGYIL